MNYIGSKRLLLDFIDHAISQCNIKQDNLTICDIFSGTGHVAKHFKRKGHTIIANDLEKFSHSLIRHYIGNHEEIKISKYLEELNKLKGINTGFIFNNYCPSGKHSTVTKVEDGLNVTLKRRYFTNQNGQIIDEARSLIEYWKSSNEIDLKTYHYLLAVLIESSDKIANTTSVYGAFLKQFKKGAERKISFSLIENIITPQRHYVFNEDANELVKEISGDVLYLDPPYNGRQYGSNYHVLNTINNQDAPEIRGVTGMRDYNTSLWCKKGKVESIFEDLIKNADFKYILLSYNNEGLMSHETIEKIMSKYGDYKVITKDYARFKADKEHDKRKYKANSVVEYIHILEKK